MKQRKMTAIAVERVLRGASVFELREGERRKGDRGRGKHVGRRWGRSRS